MRHSWKTMTDLFKEIHIFVVKEDSNDPALTATLYYDGRCQEFRIFLNGDPEYMKAHMLRHMHTRGYVVRGQSKAYGNISRHEFDKVMAEDKKVRQLFGKDYHAFLRLK